MWSLSQVPRREFLNHWNFPSDSRVFFIMEFPWDYTRVYINKKTQHRCVWRPAMWLERWGFEPGDISPTSREGRGAGKGILHGINCLSIHAYWEFLQQTNHQSSENTKQDRCPQNYTYACHIQTSENQRQKENCENSHKQNHLTSRGWGVLCSISHETAFQKQGRNKCFLRQTRIGAVCCQENSPGVKLPD